MENENAKNSPEASRRQFLKIAAGTIAVVSGGLLAAPTIGSLVIPTGKEKLHFARVGDLASMPVGQPLNIRFADQVADAYIRETVTRNVWVIKHSPTTAVTVFSPICPHLGCRFHWDEQSEHFICPCHGSVFALDGKVLAGPAPRPLDTLPIKITDDELSVEWELFELGIPQKVAV